MASARINRKAALTAPPGGFTNHLPATIVAEDERTDTDRAQARAAYDIWFRELQEIRRERPLLKSSKVTDIVVVTSNRTKSTRFKEVEVVDLIDSDDDDADGEEEEEKKEEEEEEEEMNKTKGIRGAIPAPPPAVDGREVEGFYLDPNRRPIDKSLLTYQRRRGKAVNQYPAPGMLRLDLAKLGQKIHFRRMTDEERAVTTKEQLWGTATSVPKPFEVSLQQDWLRDRDVGAGARLIRGLPMMEDVVFYRAGNYLGLASNCFWKAVAYHVYGHHSFDVRVKAEHLEYFSEVLQWPQHPKCEWSMGSLIAFCHGHCVRREACRSQGLLIQGHASRTLALP